MSQRTRIIRHEGRGGLRPVVSNAGRSLGSVSGLMSGPVSGLRGGDVVRLVLLPMPTDDVLLMVHGLARATGLSAGSATEAIVAADASGRALVLEAHRELAELHAERCRAAGLRVVLEGCAARASSGGVR